MSSDFRIAGLTEQVAVSLYSVVGVTGKCRCTGDCASPQTRCGCRAKGIFCTLKCHGGRGSIGDRSVPYAHLQIVQIYVCLVSKRSN